jgi:aldehyde dehydrogenase (NAD+)
MGPVAGRQQYQDIAAAIGKAQRDGAQLLAGGNPEPLAASSGYFIRPTIFADVAPDMPIWQDEIFGPVVAVREFSSIDEAVEMANTSIYGLSSAIFTNSIQTAAKYVDGIETGLAHVNVHTGYKEPSMPFGGFKMSGAGLPENGETGLEFFTRRKAVYVRA